MVGVKKNWNRLNGLVASAAAAFVAVSTYVVGASSIVGDIPAFVLLRKELAEDVVVKGRNMTVVLSAYNAGGSPAYQVSLSDENWSSDSWEFIEGSMTATTDKVKPGETFTHSFVLRPKFSGEYAHSPASISYAPILDADPPVSGVSSIPSNAEVISATSAHILKLLEAGKYLSFGYCKTAADWKSTAIWTSLVGGALGANYGTLFAKKAMKARKAAAALKEFEE